MMPALQETKLFIFSNDGATPGMPASSDDTSTNNSNDSLQCSIQRFHALSFVIGIFAALLVTGLYFCVESG